MNKLYIYVAAVTVAVAGCGTPPAVLKQADDGVAITAALALELRAFEKAETASAQFVLESAAYQRKQANALNKAVSANDLAGVATGDAQTLLVIATSEKYLADLANLDVIQLASSTDVTKATTSVLAPLPSTTEMLTDTQAKFAVFGKELSNETRAKEFKVVFDAVKKTVDSNKAKMTTPSATAAAVPIN